jgi:hypothetical protein
VNPIVDDIVPAGGSTDVLLRTPAEAAAFAAKETAMWRELVRLSGWTPQ